MSTGQRRPKAWVAAGLAAVLSLGAACGGSQDDRVAQSSTGATAPPGEAGATTAGIPESGAPASARGDASPAMGGSAGATGGPSSVNRPAAAGGQPPAADQRPTPGAATPGTTPAKTPAAPTGSGSPGSGKTPATPSLGASDVGVSPTTIKLGVIGSISGALPGQFLPSIQAAQAYYNLVNERGGINGRKIQAVVVDDALDATKNLSEARRLVEDEKVFAIAPEISPAMDASAKYLDDNKVPVVGAHGALGNSTSAFRAIFPVLGAQSASSWTTVYSDYGKQFGSRCGIIDSAIAISQQSGRGQEFACKQSGLTVPYHATVQVVQPDFTAEITRMRTSAVDFLVSILDLNSNVRMMQAMRRQNYIPNPVFFTAYDDAVAESVSDVLEKSVTATLGGAPLEPEWVARNPELTLMQATVKKYFRDTRKTVWTLFGWQGAMLLAEAAQAVGPDLTREGLMAKLESYRGYDFRGTAWPQNLRFKERSQFSLCTPLLTWAGSGWSTVRGLDNCGQQVKF